MDRGHAFIAWILVGIAIGWFAGKMAKSPGYGRPMDIATALAGSLVGGFLTTHYGFGAVSKLGLSIRLLIAAFGAVTLTFLVRMIGLAIHSSRSSTASKVPQNAKRPCRYGMAFSILMPAIT
jgi:uncharacterized membrane protein YeaQ/YmgE (transglycosylase-associated protein family)